MRLAVKALIPYNAICDMSDMGNIFFRCVANATPCLYKNIDF